MTLDEVIINGIISFVSAIIGGAIALIGTWIAIRHEKNIDRNEKEESARPFFELLDYMDPRTEEANKNIYHFSKDEEFSKYEPNISGNVINSDKVEFIIKKFTVDGEDYFPIYPEMISKTMRFRMVVHLKKPIDNEKVYMHIININHNEKVYKIEYEGTRIIRFYEYQEKQESR